jgi:hypothetical protein
MTMMKMKMMQSESRVMRHFTLFVRALAVATLEAVEEVARHTQPPSSTQRHTPSFISGACIYVPRKSQML